MPPLQRTIHSVIVPFVAAEIKREAEKEGLDAAYILRNLDILVDYVHSKYGKTVRMSVEFYGKITQSFDVKLTEDDVRMADNAAIERGISSAMRGNISLVAQLHFARLSRIFPGRIKEVHAEHSMELAERIIAVEFINGHVAEAPESEVKTDLFTARCMMLYDLPPV